MSGCTGACCVAFCVSSNSAEGIADRVTPKGDGHVLEDMLIEISEGEAVLRLAAFGGNVKGVRPGGGRPWFKCRHWDEGTRLCRIYERRPKMCRDYPHGEGKCEHGCSCAGAPRGKVAA